MAACLAIISFKNNGGFFRLCIEMPVQAVIGNIEFAIIKPFEEGMIALVQYARKGFVPDDVLACHFAPESLQILFGFSTKCAVSIRSQVGFAQECGIRRKNTVFLQNGLESGQNASRK